MSANKVILPEIARRFCEEIRAKNKEKWYSIWRLQCFFCHRFAGGDTAKMCISNKQGCPQVNKRYEL